jgi:hypothetical protein
LFGNEAILGEHKFNAFTDVICGRGSCADLTWTSSTNGLICQFDKDRKLLAHRNLQVTNDFQTIMKTKFKVIFS